MRIVVINGSPAGVNGATAQHVEYLRREFPEHEFQIVEASRRIRHLDPTGFLDGACPRTRASPIVTSGNTAP